MINNESKIILLGPPGSGKGSASKNLISKFPGLTVISTGDIFRKKMDEESDLANTIREYICQGKLIPDEITNDLVKTEILYLIKNKKGILLDGYPRTIKQAKFLATVCDISKVFYFEIDQNILLKRIIGRRLCPVCGNNYNIFFNKPKEENTCDNCQTLLVQRKDDNEKTFSKRMEEFNNKTAKLVNYYKEINKLIIIDSSQSVKKVLEEMLRNESN